MIRHKSLVVALLYSLTTPLSVAAGYWLAGGLYFAVFISVVVLAVSDGLAAYIWIQIDESNKVQIVYPVMPEPSVPEPPFPMNEFEDKVDAILRGQK